MGKEHYGAQFLHRDRNGAQCVVNDVIFKGVHFEMHVECEGREWLIHSTRACTPGETIGMRIGPNEIHIMARSEG